MDYTCSCSIQISPVMVSFLSSVHNEKHKQRVYQYSDWAIKLRLQ